MKKVILLLLALNLISCSTNVEEITSYKYQGAWYWVLEHKQDATKEDVLKFVKRWANPNTTSYFFVYSDTYNLDEFKKQNITFPYFRDLILANKPTYGFYKMSTDQKIYDDAVWLLEQSVK